MKYLVGIIVVSVIILLCFIVFHLINFRKLMNRPGFQKYKLFSDKAKNLFVDIGIAFLVLFGLGILMLWAIQSNETNTEKNFDEVKKQNRKIYDSLISVSETIRKGAIKDSFYSLGGDKIVKSVDSLINNQTDSIKRFILNVSGRENSMVRTKVRPATWVISFCFMAFSLWLLWKYFKTKNSKYLLGSAFSSLFSFGYESLIKLDPEIGFDINIDKKKCICDTSKTVSFTREILIGPFDDGFDSIPKSVLRNAIESIQKEFGEKKIITIYITGGVDKRQLRGKSKKKFGDNFMLAQSRANMIKAVLTDTSQFKYSDVEYSVNVSAANNFRDSLSLKELAQDRVVRVRAAYLSSSDW